MFAPIRSTTRAGALHPLGDVDGEGHPDLFERPTHGVTDRTSVALHHSAPDGSWRTSTWALPGLLVRTSWTADIYPVGDLDLDGHADVVLVQRRFEQYDAALLRGTPDGLSTTPTWIHAMPPHDPAIARNTPRAAAAGDIDGDGWPDLLLSEPGWQETFDLSGTSLPSAVRGRVLGFRGGPDGTPAWTLHGDAHLGNFGRQLVDIGDVNGDGFDLATGHSVHGGRVHILFGGNMPPVTPAPPLPSPSAVSTPAVGGCDTVPTSLLWPLLVIFHLRRRRSAAGQLPSA